MRNMKYCNERTEYKNLWNCTVVTTEKRQQCIYIFKKKRQRHCVPIDYCLSVTTILPNKNPVSCQQLYRKEVLVTFTEPSGQDQMQ